jgi:hypothetical protein
MRTVYWKLREIIRGSRIFQATVGKTVYTLQSLYYWLFARIWEKRRFAGILRFCEFGYTRFHEGERLDASTGLAWV